MVGVETEPTAYVANIEVVDPDDEDDDQGTLRDLITREKCSKSMSNCSSTAHGPLSTGQGRKNVKQRLKNVEGSRGHEGPHLVTWKKHSILSYSYGQVKEIVKVRDIENDDFLGNLSKIVSFAKEFEMNKIFLAKLDGFVSMLVEIPGNGKDVNILEKVVRVLELILNKIEDQEQLKNLMLD
ncbi:hypothetical protein LWI28_008554 [Acer negundo]|uniref:Uncharacterized protein n=1 Tax=Acer negundo TaxID=4023 RepID=A0AAD5I8W2_ACENE|nr:hypothetical protein LWI28_008554 [Acer negundo]